ncbi:hypothetical protein [Pseudonocardia ailaonensis]|uniref:hypothetical protein n=1 Tax=Pseudonocardia ailaonensis TaxID=367279 RepID=UPI0031E337E4
MSKERSRSSTALRSNLEINMTESYPEPAGLGPRGSKFWSRTASSFEVGAHELELLVEIARQLDLLAALEEQLAKDGVVSTGSTGQVVAHPAVAALHTGRQLLGRLMSQLSFPDEDGQAAVESPATATARKAANTRWAMEREKHDRPSGGRRHA